MSDEINDGDSKPKKRRKGLLGGWLINILLIVVVLVGIQWWKARPMAAGPAPELQGSLITGGDWSIDAMRGRPLLVHFWATWCPVCNATDDGIDSIAEDYNVITVALQSGSDQDVLDHLREAKLGFPVINDEYGEIAHRWGVPGVPASFVIDPDGQISHSTVGYTTEIGLRGRLWAASP